MRILGIETSADESGVSLIEASGDLPRVAAGKAGFGVDFSFKVLGNAVATQIATHAQYGGIFPSMAVREHQQNLVPLLETVLREAGELCQGETLTYDLEKILARETVLRGFLEEFLKKYAKPNIDAIAVTYGPGLEPTLWVGINFAKALAAAWGVPLIPVNHMEGHVIISMITSEQFTENSAQKIPRAPAVNCKLSTVNFPLLSLLISGGHTELVLSREFMQYELLGQTRDDAVGEAFDKVARLLDLPYPGGPEISRLAAEARNLRGEPSQIALPRPMIDSDNYDFSFSGIKTAVKRLVEAHQPLTDEIKKEIALEFENAAAEVLIAKTMRAIEEFDVKTALIGGGVSANAHIRAQLAQTIKDYGADTKLLIPQPSHATDNGLMIAIAGYFRALKKEFAAPEAIRASGNLKLAQN